MKRWIQKTKIKKGALSRQLGIKIKDNIPMTLLNKIISAKVDEVIRNPTNTGRKLIKATMLIKRRALLARNLKNVRR